MIEIKRIGIEDAKLLQQVAKQTFSETFSGNNSEENMKKYLEENLSIEKLTSELSDKDSLFFLAMEDNSVVGYLKINKGLAQTERIDSNAMEIERIYVLKEWLGKKVGQLLFEKAMQIAREENTSYVWLGVWEENKRAIAFYIKNGFVVFDKHIFRLGDDEQIDWMMKKELSNGF